MRPPRPPAPSLPPPSPSFSRGRARVPVQVTTARAARFLRHGKLGVDCPSTVLPSVRCPMSSFCSCSVQRRSSVAPLSTSVNLAIPSVPCEHHLPERCGGARAAVPPVQCPSSPWTRPPPPWPSRRCRRWPTCSRVRGRRSTSPSGTTNGRTSSRPSSFQTFVARYSGSPHQLNWQGQLWAPLASHAVEMDDLLL